MKWVPPPPCFCHEYQNKGVTGANYAKNIKTMGLQVVCFYIVARLYADCTISGQIHNYVAALINDESDAYERAGSTQRRRVRGEIRAEEKSTNEKPGSERRLGDDSRQ